MSKEYNTTNHQQLREVEQKQEDNPCTSTGVLHKSNCLLNTWWMAGVLWNIELNFIFF